ncbi:MAG TPA: ammonia-forming cytochrome c nitrite reductase subunit c552 [Anaeromyxobacter sp.]|nr:ammonia-forming cytochrome c nitrite reductase subunit c552 [Anaeromyxobacter sp.]
MRRSIQLAVVLLAAGLAADARAADADCSTCHSATVAAYSRSRHATLACDTCHQNSGGHLADAVAVGGDAARLSVVPKASFTMEICLPCHQEQYDSFRMEVFGRTFYGGSSDPASAWNKTVDLPSWNVLIDGHPFVLETYEDRPMAVNQIDHQETIRPGSEACLSCHGTKVAFYMGETYRNASGQVVTIPAPTGRIRDGRWDPVAQLYLPAAGPDTGHLVHDGTSHKQRDGSWNQAVTTTFVPNGTTIRITTDGTDPAFPYQVKSVAVLPKPVTQEVKDVFGNPTGKVVTFQTIASYPEAGADINGVTGDAAADANVATVARDWLYAVGEALAFDGLDYQFHPLDPAHPTHFSGEGANWPSIESGELCNQCHDPHATKLRIVKRALIEGIARNGVNPYDPAKRNIRTFEEASRQDQINSVCAQCHSEYVGGYSANDRRDREFFPWAKPSDRAVGTEIVSGVDTLYREIFGYAQDWTHGGPVRPWQTTDPNARGYYPGQLFPIGEKLVKSQHPEAETVWGDAMYEAGASCIDCHAMKLTSPRTGKQYTSHWFTSPLNWMDLNGNSPYGVPMNPCQQCHQNQTIAQKTAEIRSIQNDTFAQQQVVQAELVRSLAAIRGHKDRGGARTPQLERAVWLHQNAHLRWEYYVQAENSMGFHNPDEIHSELNTALAYALEAQALLDPPKPGQTPVLECPQVVEGQYSDPVAIALKATDADGPPQLLRFSAGNLPAGLALEDNLDGTAAISGNVGGHGGTYLVEVAVTDGSGLRAVKTIDLRILPEATEIAYTSPQTAQAGSLVTFLGTIREVNDGSLGNLTLAKVYFELTNVATNERLVDGPANVMSTGAAASGKLKYDCTTGLAPGTYRVVARTTPGNGYYAGTSGEATLVVK